jgi:hypothetical protein
MRLNLQYGPVDQIVGQRKVMMKAKSYDRTDKLEQPVASNVGPTGL